MYCVVHSLLWGEGGNERVLSRETKPGWEIGWGMEKMVARTSGDNRSKRIEIDFLTCVGGGEI